jgi:CubicO group peptidase (beta-lactamase class C family)
MEFTSTDAARVTAAAIAARDDLHLPGISIGIVCGDALVYQQGFGHADIESRRSHDPRLRQRIGSITKTMVGLCALALVDERRLSLDDRLIDHVPELTFHGDGAAITLRQLLTHTSGIGEVAMPDDIFDTNATLWSDTPDQDVLGLFPRGITVDVAPGTKWCYANLGFALLGEIVARIEHEPIAAVLHKRIFAPLQMTHTDLLDEPHPDLTTPYHPPPSQEVREFASRNGDTLIDEPTVDGYNISGRFQYIRGGGAAGAVQSNIADMARYATALLRAGAGIVRPDTFATMIAPQWCPDERLISWGLSFQRFARFGRQMFGHGGGVLGGWNSMLLVLPGEDLALMIHVNASFDGFDALVSRLLAAVLNAAPTPPSGVVANEIIEALPGVYSLIPGRLTNVRPLFAVGRVQIKADRGALLLYSQYGRWRHGVRMYPGDPADRDFLLLDDDALEPSRLILLRDQRGAVSGLAFDRLVRMVRTDNVRPWA